MGFALRLDEVVMQCERLKEIRVRFIHSVRITSCKKDLKRIGIIRSREYVRSQTQSYVLIMHRL